MCFKKNIKVIEVSPKKGCLIYPVSFTLDKSVKAIKLIVDANCQAMLFYNGGRDGTYEQGSYDLNVKKAIRENAKIKIIGVARNQQFTIKFGIGEIPFKDRECRLNCLVGIHGDCKCAVQDGSKIYALYGNTEKDITAEMVSDDIYSKLAERLITELSNKLNEYSYNTVCNSISDLSDIIKRNYDPILNNIGIRLLECSMSQPHFPEDYVEQRNRIIQERSNNMRSPKTDDSDLLKEILASKAQDKANEKPTEIECPHCHKKNDAASKFCKFCGRKI